MEKHEISDTDIDWVSLFRHVAREQIAIEIADGTTPIAEVIPKQKPFAVRDLPGLMESLPSLGDDASSFAKDIEEARASFGQDADPWES
jgi:hypothetical protein